MNYEYSQLNYSSNGTFRLIRPETMLPNTNYVEERDRVIGYFYPCDTTDNQNPLLLITS